MGKTALTIHLYEKTKVKQTVFAISYTEINFRWYKDMYKKGNKKYIYNLQLGGFF